MGQIVTYIKTMEIEIVVELAEPFPDLGSTPPDEFQPLKRSLLVTVNSGEPMEVPFPESTPYLNQEELIEYCQSYWRDQYIKSL